MSSTKLHPSLPAPVIHSSHMSTVHSKSHVLAGVQDAYWSDEEAEDADCPLCLEEMDISDANFKPCPCGYQICRFCWHHIKENLNRRCPACRREYTDEAVQFKAISKEDHKRLTQQKKQRDRERKDIEALGFSARYAKEEMIPTLRSSDYFGQYGKISKLIAVKRSPPGGKAPILGIYITYHRREDAARAISAVDGTPVPNTNTGEVFRASHGTTKYCTAFLRDVACTTSGCMDLHEWGDEKDCFTKEDLTTLKHTMKDTETRQRSTRREGEGVLPRSSAWASKAVLPAPPSMASSSNARERTPRRGHRTGRAANGMESKGAGASTRAPQERKSGAVNAKGGSQALSSRPSTPATSVSLPQRPTSPAVSVAKGVRIQKEPVQVPAPPRSPASSIAVTSELGSGSQDTPASPKLPSNGDMRHTQTTALSPPPGLPAMPPGLAVNGPPGIPPPPSSPQVVREASTSSTYQMSLQAQALLDDVKARRESTIVTASPFPEFDGILQHLAGGSENAGGFNFTLDPTLASEGDQTDAALPDVETIGDQIFEPVNPIGLSSRRPSNSYAFSPPLQFASGSSGRTFYEAARPPVLDKPPSIGMGYSGSFNPFSEGRDDRSGSPAKSVDDDTGRRMSRFGFARERQGSGLSVTSSPVQSVDSSLYPASELSSAGSGHAPWPFQRHHAYGPPPGIPLRTSTPSSVRNSPMLAHAHAVASPPAFQSRFQPFDGPTAEAVMSKDSTNFMPESAVSPDNLQPTQAFQDPAIMASARYGQLPPPSNGMPLMSPDLTAPRMPPGPPPGLHPPNALPSLFATEQLNTSGQSTLPNGGHHTYEPATYSNAIPASPSPSTAVESEPFENAVLSPVDFPALPTVTPDTTSRPEQPPQPYLAPAIATKEAKAQTKADRKASKKAAAAEKAAEKERLAKERAEAERLTKEKERAAKERLAKENANKENTPKGQVDKERIAPQKDKVTKLRDESTNGKQSKSTNPPNSPTKPKQTKPQTVASTPDVPAQVPILSRMPKKHKPITKVARANAKDDDHSPDGRSQEAAEGERISPAVMNSPKPDVVHVRNSENGTRGRSNANGIPPKDPTSITQLLKELDITHAHLNLANHPFFDPSKINPAAKMPLEYGPLVHALSALSVGGGSFANNMPTGSIDNAVSSFQQLLETLTQTISDLLRLLPRTTWDDSSSFDGVLRDMLKGDDFLDEAGEDGNGRDDEVAALTLALERRARWMEVQLAKLEELHRDINTAAVRAVLAFNDRGWDNLGSLPRNGGTLARFDQLGSVEENGTMRPMTVSELESRLEVAKEVAAFAEAELKETMSVVQQYKPIEA